MYEIKDLHKIVPDAFHGTSKASAEQIKKIGFKISTGPGQFFGDGVYFFESSRWHAEDWARNRYGPTNVAIIAAVINLGRCLDFHNGEHRRFAMNSARELRQQMERRSTGRSAREIKLTDTLVINFIAGIIKVDTVRGSYVQPRFGALFPGSRFYGYHQLIVCVRNISNILSFQVL